MGLTGRAIVFRGPGTPLELVSRPLPKLDDGEILVRVTTCALCASDLHTHAGRRPGPVPTVLGHEIVGEIADLGSPGEKASALPPLSVGDRVTWNLTAHCGRCIYCRRGFTQKCEQLYKYGHQRVDRHPFVGGLADWIVLRPGTAVVPLTAAVSDDLAVLANCAASTAVAVLRAAGESATDRTLLILGAGVLGLLACRLARRAGFDSVLVSDTDEQRRHRALDFGATTVCGSDEAELAAAVHEISGGRGIDVALELAGTSATAAAACRSLGIGGTAVWAGTVLPVGSIPLDPESCVRRLVRIVGCHNYQATDLTAAVEWLAELPPTDPLSQLVGPQFELSEAEEAFEWGHTHPGCRALVKPTSAG